MKLYTIAALLLLLLLTSTGFTEEAPRDIAISYEKFVLDNGLTLIVHEDHKAPIVAVNVWYHVGSKDEKPGRTGFAHLFEHLMFNGSENYNDEWFKPFDRVGGTGINGTTNQDRTNYFQVVPTNALDMTLWLESDRMGHLLKAIDQDKLDEQRGVVQNEKRQGENQPYGRVFSTILENVYPEGHPYSWSVIGSMEDLNAASLEDVHDWFENKYGAANATIVIAGDITADVALAKVKKYFAHIDAGPPLIKQSRWLAKRSGKHEQIMVDRVPQARLYKIWNVPEWGSADADFLTLASGVLSSDKESRLYKRLVYRERVASDVSAFSFNSEIGGLFGVIATALDEKDLDYISEAINEEIALFIKKGPTKQELDRVKTGMRANFVRGMERIGGFGGKSDLLARNQVFKNDPNHYLKSMQRLSAADAEDVVESTKKWLSEGEYLLKVLPQPQFKTAESNVDRSTGLPVVGAAPKVGFDELQRFELSNGLRVILAERHAVPLVRMQMMFDAGFAADYGVNAGTASLTMNMLDEGTESMDALEISTTLAKLGTSLSSQAGLDSSAVSLNSIIDKLDDSLDIFADVVMRPSFSESQLERLKSQQLSQISQEKASPFGLGYRLLPKLLFGENHLYATPFTGSGDEESVQAMTVDDLKSYHQKWLTADNGTLIVVGAINKDTLLPKLEKAFGAMQGGEKTNKLASDVAAKKESTVYLVDRPGSEQTAIIAAKMVPAYGFDQELPLQLANEVLGASFSSRLNMNLREDKHWSYGARSSIQNTQSQRPFLINAPVQTDKTLDAMLEIRKELMAISEARPASEDELARALDKRTLTLPGRWEAGSSVLSDIANMERFGLNDDYWDQYVRDLAEVDLAQVHAVSKQFFKDSGIVWMVVGDLARIEDEIRAADFARVIRLDKEGNKISDSEEESSQ